MPRLKPAAVAVDPRRDRAAALRGAAACRHRGADGGVVRRRRDRLRAPRRPARGRRRGDPHLVRGLVRQRCNRRAAGEGTPAAGAELRGAQRAGTCQRAHRPGHPGGLGDGHQRLREVESRLARWRHTMPAPARRARRRTPPTPAPRCTDAAVQQYRSPRWLPGGNAQTIWPALFGQRHHGPTIVFRRERWTTPDADFIDADWLGEDTTRAAAGDVPRPRRLDAQPLRAGLRRLGAAPRLALRDAAFPRLLGRTEPRAARLPLGRLRGDRLDAGPGEAAPCRADRRRGRLAGRQRAAALGRGGGRHRLGHRQGGRRDQLADRPRRRRPRHRPRLQPAGLHTHVPAQHEAARAGQAGAAPGPVQPREAARGTRPVRVRQRLHRAAARLPRYRRLLGARLGEAAPARASASRRWCSMRATTPSCPAPACRAATRSAARSRCGSRRMAGMSVFPAGAGPVM